jgi:hypothetical protein
MRRAFPLAAFLVLSALALGGALPGGLACAEPPEPAPKPDDAGPGTAPAAPNGTKAPAKPDDATRAGVLAAVDEIRAEVAKVRGLAWKSHVPADLLSREQLIANIEQMTKDELDPEEYAKDVKMMRRLGMLSETEDPLEMVKRFLGVGVQGYYDPKKKHFFMIDGPSIEGQKPVIFHELVHALDDQYHDLEKRQEAVKKDSDRLFALKCTLEGCAEHARAMYEAAHPEVAKPGANDEQKQAAEQMKVMRQVPAFLVLPTLLHYKIGPAFVGRAVGDDFPGGMAKLYADMPVSEEQVLHPEKYLSPDRDLPQTITFSADLACSGGEDCRLFDDDVMGELDLSFWLDYHLGSTGGKVDFQGLAQGRMLVPQARQAASGWDGMRMAFLEKPGVPLAIVVVGAWDTPKDAQEAGEAMRLAFQRQYRTRFEGGPVAEKDGVRRADWTGANGAGRLEVRGSNVYLVDGFPAAGLDALFAEVRKTKFARDPKDTWDPAKVADPFVTAAWKDEARGVAWAASGTDWTATKDEKDASVTWLQRAGGPRVRVTTTKDGLQPALFRHLTEIRPRLPEKFDLMSAIADATVAGKSAGHLTWTEAAASGPLKHRTTFVALEAGTLVVEVEAPEADWPAAQKAHEEALKGFLVRED